MRLDRFITLNLAQPLRRARPPFTIHDSRSTSLPVLMFHSISDDPESGMHPYYRVCTSPARFREQMQWLNDNGYRGVTLGAGLAWLGLSSKTEDERRKVEVAGRNSTSSALNSELRPAVLTFDDGFRDFYTTARPILREFGFTATMYLPTAFIGDTRRAFTSSRRRGAVPTLAGAAEGASGRRESDERCRGETSLSRRVGVSPSAIHHPPSSFRSRDCLTWSEIKELHATGIEFGSHTVNHPKLTELSWPEIESEMRNSKSEIESHLGVPCTAFAYPYAFPQANLDFTARFKSLLLAGGYEACVTTQIGRHQADDGALQIKRLPVNQEDDLPLFAAKLAGAYDWLGRFQSLSKTLRRNRKVPAQIPASPQPSFGRPLPQRGRGTG